MVACGHDEVTTQCVARCSVGRDVRGLALLGALVLAAPAAAQEPGGGTAPAYPGNTLELAQSGTIVTGTVAAVTMSGHAEWGEPTDETTQSYSLSMYLQNADVLADCAPSYGQQLQNGINIDLSASASISGWVMQDDISILPAPPASGIDWSTASLPFVVEPGLDNVILCAYQRYIIDDVAWYQLPLKVAQPRCRARESTVRRRLRLKCNVSGAVVVRFRGPRSRIARTKLSTKDGTGSVSTRGLRPGRYRVTVTAGELRLGGSFRIRVR
jgi:hypothetical protein